MYYDAQKCKQPVNNNELFRPTCK